MTSLEWLKYKKNEATEGCFWVSLKPNGICKWLCVHSSLVSPINFWTVGDLLNFISLAVWNIYWRVYSTTDKSHSLWNFVLCVCSRVAQTRNYSKQLQTFKTKVCGIFFKIPPWPEFPAPIELTDSKLLLQRNEI